VNGFLERSLKVVVPKFIGVCAMFEEEVDELAVSD